MVGYTDKENMCACFKILLDYVAICTLYSLFPFLLVFFWGGALEIFTFSFVLKKVGFSLIPQNRDILILGSTIVINFIKLIVR